MEPRARIAHPPPGHQTPRILWGQQFNAWSDGGQWSAQGRQTGEGECAHQARGGEELDQRIFKDGPGVTIQGEHEGNPKALHPVLPGHGRKRHVC